MRDSERTPDQRQYILYILFQTTYKRVQRGYKQQFVIPTCTMASPELSSLPLSLLALPPEIYAAILPFLRFYDLYTLRLVN
jgi:hypothetical protein